MTLNMCHMSSSAFTKFEFGQLVHSWLIAFFSADTIHTTLRPWFVTLWPWTFVIYRLSRDWDYIPNLRKIGNWTICAAWKAKNRPYYATFNHPVKIRWQIWKLSKSERRPSISAPVDVLDFGYFALFRNHSALKSCRIENGSQILHFLIWLLRGKI